MTPLEKNYENLSATLIKNLEKRNMTGYYVKNSAAALELAKTLIKEGSTISFGGSETLSQIGILDYIRQVPSFKLIDRAHAKSPTEVRKIYLESFTADYYLMSTNAITHEGELINIDGNGNRVAALIYGPEKVFLFVGMNKVVPSIAEGISRAQNVASPANTVRLNKHTPCAKTGVCHQCTGSDTICCQIVTTRYSRHDNRIHVILIGESLGY